MTTDIWLSVQDAAFLAHRKPGTIYAWIEKGHLRKRIGPNGVIQVRGFEVMEAESKVRPGRPAGTARPQSATRRPEGLALIMKTGEDVYRQSRTTPKGPST